ncbi:hypothetical protein [Glaesserella sp.]|uniref:hypothetical protein n=1 Tax=Glaesserella sp. TaxID=2094731 RepID=UPI0035A1CF61
MKTFTKVSLLVLSFMSTPAFADAIPIEIYDPIDAEIVKADRKGRGEFEAEFRLRGDDVRPLAESVIDHAYDEGFRLEESEIDREDADLKFRRGDQRLDVQIELKDRYRIEYKADLDLDR